MLEILIVATIFVALVYVAALALVGVGRITKRRVIEPAKKRVLATRLAAFLKGLAARIDRDARRIEKKYVLDPAIAPAKRTETHTEVRFGQAPRVTTREVVIPGRPEQAVVMIDTPHLAGAVREFCRWFRLTPPAPIVMVFIAKDGQMVQVPAKGQPQPQSQKNPQPQGKSQQPQGPQQGQRPQGHQSQHGQRPQGLAHGKVPVR